MQRLKATQKATVLVSIENVTGSPVGRIRLWVMRIPNVIKGGGGNDRLSGAGQNDDDCTAGAGNDTLMGASGS